ncbi:hypothetical protein [Devosia sp. A16]|uniref:hypothetical protein n=1 Tax=Devosia sp. A16 TaxID=1736675 RepID=UPI0006D7C14C|nr:hypothetical protein [Devosia sp. A16]
MTEDGRLRRNAKAIEVRWLAGRGYQASDIARFLGDGTTDEAIRTQLQRTELEKIGGDRSSGVVS